MHSLMIRRHALWVLAGAGLASTHASTHASAPTAPQTTQDGAQDLAGRWIGDARLFDRALRAQAIPLPAELLFEPDLALSGRMGDAHWPRTLPTTAEATRIEYRLRLQGVVHALPALHKPCLVVIVTRGRSSTLDADFHLKSRFGFDPSMRVGHLDVVRGA